MGILDRFFVALGFQVDTEGLDKFEAKTAELRAGIFRLGALFTGAAIGIGMMVEKTVEGLDSIERFAQLNQLNAREVAAWNRVAMLNHVSQEEAQSSLQTLNQRLGEAAVGLGRGRMIFERLGLAARDSSGHVKTLDGILGDVAAKMQASGSRAVNIAMARRLGIDEKLVPLLEKGREEYRKLREEAMKLNPLSDEDYARAEEVELMMRKAARTVTIIRDLIAAKLLPAVQRALDTYLKWFDNVRGEGSNVIIKAFTMLAGILGNIWGWVEKLWDVSSSVLDWLMKFRATTYLIAAGVGLWVSYKLGTWLIGVASAISTLAESMMTLKAASVGPVMLFGALVLALGLLIDDMVNFYEGNDSVIGQLQEKFPAAIYLAHAAVLALTGAIVAMKWKALTSLIETVRIVWMYASQWAVAMWNVAAANLAATWEIVAIIAAIVAVIAIIYELYKHWDKVSAFFVAAWNKITDGVSRFIGKIKEAIQWVKSLWDSAPDWLKIGVSIAANPIGAAIDAYKNFNNQPTATSSFLTPVPLGPSSRSHTIINTIDRPQINVYSPDPDKAGQSVNRELDKLHRGATRDAQGGVGI